jgi:hypothetical protein
MEVQVDCTGAKERMTPALAGELTSEERDALFLHLEGCRVCRGEYEDLKRMWEILGLWTDVTPPETLDALVLEQVRSVAQSWKVWSLRLGRAAAPVALAAALLMLLAAWLLPYEEAAVWCSVALSAAGLPSLPDAAAFFVVGLLYASIPLLTTWCFLGKARHIPEAGIAASLLYGGVVLPYVIFRCLHLEPLLAAGLIVGTLAGAMAGGLGGFSLVTRWGAAGSDGFG